MSSKPTIVFVPGAWHSASCYDKVITLLSPTYKCVAVSLPTTDGTNTKSFIDDVTAVRNAILAETTAGHDIVVIAHSYGGQVANSSFKGLAKSTSTPLEAGKGHVIGQILLASGFAITGLGFLEAAGGKPPPSWIADEESGFATLVADPKEMFYHDLPSEEGDYWVSKLTKQSLKALSEGGEHVYSGWKDVPNWFIATTEDKAFPIEVQRFFATDAKTTGDVTWRELKSGHSVMLALPEETAAIVKEAVAAFEAK